MAAYASVCSNNSEAERTFVPGYKSCLMNSAWTTGPVYGSWIYKAVAYLFTNSFAFLATVTPPVAFVMRSFNTGACPAASTSGRKAVFASAVHRQGFVSRASTGAPLPRRSRVVPGSSSHDHTHSDAASSQAKVKSSPPLLSEPMSMLDVDQELWELLDLCSDDELESVYTILHSQSPFSPVVKSLVAEKEPPLLELRGRLSVMHKVETRFRFLAADPASLIGGKRPRYRDTLLAIKDSLDVPCSSNLSTYDLETEIFLHVWHHAIDYVQSDIGPDPDEAAAVAMQAEELADGMGSMAGIPRKKQKLTERLTAPFRFGIKELIPTFAKFVTSAAVTAAGRNEARKLGVQLFKSHMRQQAALAAAKGVARETVSGWGKTAMLEAAQKGVTVATARYSAMQGVLSFLGPVMWGWLAMDLALKSIGTDYARIIRAVFFLAQVRLVRTKGFTQPSLPPKISSTGADKVDSVV
eukprot:gene5100-34900_t